MKCVQCGGTIPDNAAFCPQCGTRTNPAVRPSPPPLPPEYRSPAASIDVFRRPPLISAMAVLNYVGAVFYLLGAAGLFTAFLRRERPVLAIILGVSLLLIAAIHFLGGRGLWSLKSYGRTIQLVYAWIWLIAFPIGTVICILILIYLFKPEIKILFSGKRLSELNQAETNMLAKLNTSSMNAAAVAGVVGAALFMIVAVGGIVAAIAIPNLLNAIQRGKQKRTMADIRSIGSAVESYAMDHNAYPPATSSAELSRYLEPTYISKMPEMDAWMHAFRYIAWKREGSERPDEYMVLSAGKDGIFEHDDAGQYPDGSTTNFNDDIVFSNGAFVRYPE